MEDTTEVVTAFGEHPAAVTIRAADNALLALVRERNPSVDEDFLGEHEPYFWEAEISSDRLDSYFTHMDKTSLRNYAADAERGVPFMNSHRTGGLFSGAGELPLGRSISAKFNPGKTGEPTTTAVFYTFRGLKLGEVASDDFINGVRSGIVKDVSIGFMKDAKTRYICDICDEDVFRSETCFHFPGMHVEVGEGKSKKTVIATARIVDARLAEVSAVYKGSTPGAMITKAQRMSAAHQLPPQTLTFLEDTYRILMPGSARTYTWTDSGTNGYANRRGGGPNPDLDPTRNVGTDAPVKDEGMGDNDTATNTDALAALQRQMGEVRTLLGVGADADPLASVRTLQEELGTVKTELEGLRAQAADGKAYRDDLVAQVVTEGKRAFGEGFNEEQQTALLKVAPVETLKSTRDAYKGVADKLFPAGRVTKDDENDGEKDEAPPARRPARNRRAYAA